MPDNRVCRLDCCLFGFLFLLSGMARVRLADLNGPKWTPSGQMVQNGAFWSIVVLRMLKSGGPLKTTFDMTTLIFSFGGCPSYPVYPLKRVPSYPFLAENPSSEGATKDHLSSKPPQGEPPGTKNQSGR